MKIRPKTGTVLLAFLLPAAHFSAPDPPIAFTGTRPLNLAAGTRFLHYRVAARFALPLMSVARLRSRGAFPELEVHAVDNDDFVIITTTLALRRHRNLARAGRRDRNGCGFPPLPDAEKSRVEGVCDFLLSGNHLRKRMTLAREGDLLHVFSATYRAELETAMAQMLADLNFAAPWRPGRESQSP